MKHNSIYRYGICISETYFDSSIFDDDKIIQLGRCNLIRTDHPSNTRRGVVCIYYKESLGTKSLDVPCIIKCLLCEVSVQNKRGHVSAMYRYPIQNNDELDEFLNSFEKSSKQYCKITS